MNMIERAARALLAAPTRNDTFSSFVHHDEAISAARAVIMSMREPSEGMVDAGRWPAEDDGALACWRAMIDAALQDG